MNAFLIRLAYSPLIVFAWVVYVARIAYLVLEAWWTDSEIRTPSRPRQASAIRSRMKKILRAMSASV